MTRQWLPCTEGSEIIDTGGLAIEPTLHRQRLTAPIEQDNSNIRHFLARFRRRTKVVSKAVEMVDLSLRIYHHFHDNLDALAAKAAVFQSIFG